MLQRQVSAPPYSIFTQAEKIWIISLVSISALISPFGATLFYPVLNVLSDVLHVTPTMTNISITTYMIAQAIAPAIIGGMSDNSGRRLSFIVCFVIFIAANIGLALQTNYVALLILRILQAFGCSAAISLSVAVVADVSTSAERGKYMGYATSGILFGPAFGPTIGGILARYLGWRSTFWFLAIFAGTLLVLFVFLFPETCRAVVGNGSIPAKGVNRSVLSYLRERRHSRESVLVEENTSAHSAEKRKFKLPNPLSTLKILGEKESCIVLLYNGLFFTGMMVVSAALPDLFLDAYGLDELKIGLCYISIGTGCLISSLTTGHIVDWNFRRHARHLNMPIVKGKQQDLSNFPIEQVRMQIVAPGHVIGTLGLVAFGWTVKYRTHIAGPEVALFVIGFGVSTAFNITNTLLIDLHRNQPATATAAVNFVRCLMSAGGCAAIIPMCHAMNPGWAFTFIALIYTALIGVVFWVMKAGMRWRQEAEREKRMKDGSTHPEPPTTGRHPIHTEKK
ncbi:MFS general substrate transporter [Lentithecium fluviatile CBS 122367]|uniref:MFS general substrate transporter n=1 Tax=Lentithecium fluviatile CBS 122367 TaxID=1168545 RepID=A0A6G1IW37_9PLEO|nr:MFS general substrate transporter [Lentithecium fluviatile CBS 122367]